MERERHQEEISRVAYELYEKRGGGHGSHFDDWLEAERIVMARHATSAKAPAAKGAESAKTRTTKPRTTVKKTEASGVVKKGTARKTTGATGKKA